MEGTQCGATPSEHPADITLKHQNIGLLVYEYEWSDTDVLIGADSLGGAPTGKHCILSQLQRALIVLGAGSPILSIFKPVFHMESNQSWKVLLRVEGKET